MLKDNKIFTFEVMEPVVMSWSGGKDSSLALHRVLQEKKYDVRYLLTTINEKFERVSMHGVRANLIRDQARKTGIPLLIVRIPENSTHEIYKERMEKKLLEVKERGVEKVIFGDIFLEDLKEFREKQLEQVGMKAVFPLWQENTGEMAQLFIKESFQAVIVCTDNKKLNKTFTGRIYDEQFLNDLPSDVDPCGENGEFHSFVFGGPLFNEPVEIVTGEKVVKVYKGPEGEHPFTFCDILKIPEQ